MINIKLTISIILLFLTLPGCLARYGEDRLEHLCKSIKDLEKECKENREELTEEEIKVVLNSKFIDDSVSEISRLLRYITLNLLTLSIDWNDDMCNSNRKEDEFYKHITPGFVDGRTRLKYDGYLNSCLTDFFK